MKIESLFIYDARHGWLRVSRQDFKNVTSKTNSNYSRFSYFDDSFVYLEEDCDAGQFERDCIKVGAAIDLKGERNDGDYSSIRNKKRGL